MAENSDEILVETTTEETSKTTDKANTTLEIFKNQIDELREAAVEKKWKICINVMRNSFIKKDEEATKFCRDLLRDKCGYLDIIKEIRTACQRKEVEVISWLISTFEMEEKIKEEIPLNKTITKLRNEEIERQGNGRIFDQFKTTFIRDLKHQKISEECKGMLRESYDVIEKYVVFIMEKEKNFAISKWRKKTYSSKNRSKLNIIDWLYTLTKLAPLKNKGVNTPEEIQKLKIVEWDNKFEIIKWMIVTFKLTREWIIKENRESFGCMLKDLFQEKCPTPHILWFINTLKLQTFGFMLSHEFNHKEIMDKLTVDTGKNIGPTFRMTCAKNNWESAKRLLETHNLSRNILLDHFNFPFRMACQWGNLEMAKILCEKVKISDEEVRKKIEEEEHHKGKDVNTSAEAFMITRRAREEAKRINKENAMACNNYALVEACLGRHFEVVKWICDTFYPDLTVVRKSTKCKRFLWDASPSRVEEYEVPCHLDNDTHLTYFLTERIRDEDAYISKEDKKITSTEKAIEIPTNTPTKIEILEREKEECEGRKKVHEERKREYETVRSWVEKRFDISLEKRTWGKKK